MELVVFSFYSFHLFKEILNKYMKFVPKYFLYTKLLEPNVTEKCKTLVCSSTSRVERDSPALSLGFFLNDIIYS